MEIKSTLNKPYTEEQRMDFIVSQNHNLGYEIRETETELQAWGYTQEEIEEQEQARIQALSMTRSDFFDGTIKAFGADADDLLLVIQQVLQTLEISDIEKKVAINNYKNALNFYRKHPLFTMLSNIPLPISEDVTITITPEQWERIQTLTKNYYLLI